MSTEPGAAPGPSDPRHPSEVVRDVVLTVPGVSRLHSGQVGGVATYLPGRRVSGVRLAEDGARVDVVLAYGSPLRATADAVRRAVQAVRPGRVDVTVQDVEPAPPAVGAP